MFSKSFDRSAFALVKLEQTNPAVDGGAVLAEDAPEIRLDSRASCRSTVA
jgi:hypothetical protein